MGVRYPLFLLIPAIVSLVSCSSSSNSKVSTRVDSGSSAAAPVDYSPRVGIGVVTGSRSCFAIQNANMQPNTPVTVVVPSSPQSFSQAQIGGPSAQPCPITRDVSPGWASYDLSGLPAGTPKLTPLIVVGGTSAAFLTENISVQADLDANGQKESFHECGANDGIHLSVWRGLPGSGTVLWRGYYYEAGNPGTLPTCTVAEAPAAPAAS